MNRTIRSKGKPIDLQNPNTRQQQTPIESPKFAPSYQNDKSDYPCGLLDPKARQSANRQSEWCLHYINLGHHCGRARSSAPLITEEVKERPLFRLKRGKRSGGRLFIVAVGEVAPTEWGKGNDAKS